ncbi:hypothetical protein [Nocardioides convexus]|uniref:hypothetical protein n=1 Tax=Nocardioides convexus TaxID=2712224 RepID=UPI0031010A9B
MTTILMVGTRKGLWVGTSPDRDEWTFTGPHHDMEEVYSCLVDTRGGTPRLFAGASSSLAGPAGCAGQTTSVRAWQETPNGAIRFPEGAGASVERIWQPGARGRGGRAARRHRAGRGVHLP